MALKKYKYYFRKPRSEIVKDIFSLLLASGVILIAASSPYFVRSILKNFNKLGKYSKKRIDNTFYNLKKQGLIKIESRNHQIYVSLTNEGRRKAGIFQINNLKIKKPKKWDKKWRIAMFDISENKKIRREALRGKLKELGFYQLQKSVWVYPYDCQSEIELLKDFFNLSQKEIKIVVAEKVSDDRELKEFFQL